MSITHIFKMSELIYRSEFFYKENTKIFKQKEVFTCYIFFEIYWRQFFIIIKVKSLIGKGDFKLQTKQKQLRKPCFEKVSLKRLVHAYLFFLKHAR